MKNPLKFIQEVKQEAFRVTWPTKKDTLTGGLMVFGLASIAAIFFLILDQILRFLLNLLLFKISLIDSTTLFSKPEYAWTMYQFIFKN